MSYSSPAGAYRIDIADQIGTAFRTALDNLTLVIEMALLQKPVILMVGLYRGGNRYDIHLETFLVGGGISRRPTPVEIEALVGRYVSRLEHYCRAAPYNWFNFYNFWD